MNYYTTVEQSKKLLELGLNPETADMTYYAITERIRGEMIIKDWQVDIGLDIAIKENLFSYRNGYIVPCWSLGALLEVMPKEITDKDDIDYKLLLDVKDGFSKYYSTSYEVYHGDFPYPIRDEGKTLFEYLVEEVVWLLENGYIKK